MEANKVSLLVVGDRKGPVSFELPSARFVSLNEQQAGPFTLGKSTPTGHYARKNIGYLLAIAGGATCIYETDDDNAPMPGWSVRKRTVSARVAPASRWTNVYQYFTERLIWPRGYPLEHVRQPLSGQLGDTQSITSSIQQALANGSPDVDAIWRLVLDRDVTFDNRDSVALPTGTYCPINSQSTWWWRPAFPLMYLPSHCSFRMTDIWRGIVAQRCLWELQEMLVFHPPEVHQARNEHRLLSDFREEIPGYLRNDEIAHCLMSVTLKPGVENVTANLLRCYEVLVGEQVMERDELRLLHDWITDLGEISK
jgi:hypothetical protein